MNTEFDRSHPENYELTEHPVAASVGILGGGTAGTTIGLTLAGPVGAVVGGIIGAVIGGVGGSAVAEAAAPSEAVAYEPLMVPPTDREISDRAWRYFEEQGRTHGHDFDDWIRAERDLYHEALAARGGAPAAHVETISEAA